MADEKKYERLENDTVMTNTPLESPMGERRKFVQEVDEGCEVNKHLKRLQERDQEIKKTLRKQAEEAGLEVGKSVELRGSKHVATVFRPHDKVSVKEDCLLQDVLRVKAVVGNDAITVTPKVIMKKGVSLARIREKLGTSFNEFFVESCDVVVDVEKLSSWKEEMKKHRVGAAADETLKFVEDRLVSVPQTSSVKY